MDKWEKVKATLPELETVKAYKGRKAYQSWDNNPQRWHDKAELKASAKRLQKQGFMYDPDKTPEENEAIWMEKMQYYRDTRK